MEPRADDLHPIIRELRADGAERLRLYLAGARSPLEVLTQRGITDRGAQDAIIEVVNSAVASTIEGATVGTPTGQVLTATHALWLVTFESILLGARLKAKGLI